MRSRRLSPLALTVLLSGCALNVWEPRQVLDPVPVALIDEGIHSSIVLPCAEDTGPTDPGPLRRADVFAYGEWKWFALNQENWWRVPEVLLVPTPGALGSARLAGFWSPPPGSPAAAEHGLYTLRVERWRAARLHARLSAAMAAGADQAVENPQRGLRFVPASQPYHALHHCNHVVAGWLSELGCRVEGDGLWADFRVVPRDR